VKFRYKVVKLSDRNWKWVLESDRSGKFAYVNAGTVPSENGAVEAVMRNARDNAEYWRKIEAEANEPWVPLELP
jgi:hypothetical protein